MTERLYYHNPYLKSCTATVLECRKNGEHYEVLLDRTVIFPEGGGQPSDTGMINGIKVLRANDCGEDIWNVVDSPIIPGSSVTVTIDFDRRFDHSQQHTGEHIVSGLAHKLFNATNVGFHMAEEYVTIDFDIPLTDEQLLQLETEANAAVCRNIPITVNIVEEAELPSVPLRKRASGLTGDIRIVSIDGVDSCTCCGTHTETSAEVGIVKFTDHAKYKQGVRIWLVCGMRALEDYRKKQLMLTEASRQFSTKWENVPQMIAKQSNELSEQKRLYKLRTAKYLAYRSGELLINAKELKHGCRLVYTVEDALSGEELKLLCESLCAQKGVVAVVFTKNGDSLFYQLMRSENVTISMRRLIEAINVALVGKGGGRDDRVQGSAKLTDSTEGALEQLESYLISVIKAE